MALSDEPPTLQGLADWCGDFAIRYSALEFVVEVMAAHWLVGMSADEAVRAAEDIASPYRRPWTNQAQIDEAEMRAASERMATHLEHILRKALSRSERLRAAPRSPDGRPPPA